MGQIVKYKHHGAWVKVDGELKGHHREHCLCFRCGLFAPGTPNNCAIAQQVFATCEDLNLVTPVYECPAMVEGAPDLSGMPD